MKWGREFFEHDFNFPYVHTIFAFNFNPQEKQFLYHTVQYNKYLSRNLTCTVFVCLQGMSKFAEQDT